MALQRFVLLFWYFVYALDNSLALCSTFMVLCLCDSLALCIYYIALCLCDSLAPGGNSIFPAADSLHHLLRLLSSGQKRPSTTFIRPKKDQALLSFGQQQRPSRAFIRPKKMKHFFPPAKKTKHYFHLSKKDQALLSSVQKRPSTTFIRPKKT